MTYNVLVTEPVSMTGITLLKEHGFHIVMGTGYDEDTLIREARHADAVLTRNGHFTERVLSSCPNLRVISMHGVGVDCIDVRAAELLGIQVTNAADSNSTAVSEFTIGLLLDLAKKIPQYQEELKNGNWASRISYSGMDVEGKTLGILGMGRIGTSVARKASYGLGMKVLGFKRGISCDIAADYGTLTPDLDRVLSQADFLSIHLPLNSGTHHLMDRKRLGQMKEGAFLLNLGRGEVVDESALIDLLRSGRLAGAALDVLEGDVPDQDNPLLHMEQVIVTPHIAGLSRQALERMSYQAALGIVETLEGREPTFPVNRPGAWKGISVA